MTGAPRILLVAALWLTIFFGVLAPSLKRRILLAGIALVLMVTANAGWVTLVVCLTAGLAGNTLRSRHKTVDA